MSGARQGAQYCGFSGPGIVPVMFRSGRVDEFVRPLFLYPVWSATTLNTSGASDDQCVVRGDYNEGKVNSYVLDKVLLQS